MHHPCTFADSARLIHHCRLQETALLNDINKLWADAVLGNRNYYALAHSDLNTIVSTPYFDF